MGRNGYGPKWSWAEMDMGRNDPESWEPTHDSKQNSYYNNGRFRHKNKTIYYIVEFL